MQARARGPPLPKPQPYAVSMPDPRQAGRALGVVAFYYPGREDPCDVLCGSGFLGNFWDLGEGGITVAHGRRDESRSFRNAEAAFQALKFWDRAADFAHLTGHEAFELKSRLAGQEDRDYAGYGSNWDAMLAVLRAKFRQERLGAALAQTGDALLLEHNNRIGRDSLWSNNGDGSGSNWLGRQLMQIREEITGIQGWSAFLAEADVQAQQWQRAVWGATAALAAAVSKASAPPASASVAICPRCQARPAWNGQPGQYCSKTCRDAPRPLRDDGEVPLCPRCGERPAWNGQPGEFCSKSCRSAAGVGKGHPGQRLTQRRPGAGPSGRMP